MSSNGESRNNKRGVLLWSHRQFYTWQETQIKPQREGLGDTETRRDDGKKRAAAVRALNTGESQYKSPPLFISSPSGFKQLTPTPRLQPSNPELQKCYKQKIIIIKKKYWKNIKKSQINIFPWRLRRGIPSSLRTPCCYSDVTNENRAAAATLVPTKHTRSVKPNSVHQRQQESCSSTTKHLSEHPLPPSGSCWMTSMVDWGSSRPAREVLFFLD